MFVEPTRSPLPTLSLAERERFLLAPYAMHAANSAGRRWPEPMHPYRGPYPRDRDRIVHSTAYRRLSGKTQVFTGEQGDYHRTRLTHTHEVTSLARTLGRALRLNEDLIEACALLHDLGHPPFGHAGEDVLDACLRNHGGFCHNRHTLRIVDELEQRYPEFPGLNLSAEVRESQLYRTQKASASSRPHLEAQVVDAADSIAYDAHDADDALELKLIALDDLAEIPLWRRCVQQIERRHAGLSERERKCAVVHELLDVLVNDLLGHTWQTIQRLGLTTPEQIRAAPTIVEPSPEMAEQKRELETFLYQHVYRHPDVLAVRERAQEQLQAMFAGLVAHPERIAKGFQSRIARDGLERTVGDYIAGMTDRYAWQQYRQHFTAS